MSGRTKGAPRKRGVSIGSGSSKGNRKKFGFRRSSGTIPESSSPKRQNLQDIHQQGHGKVMVTIVQAKDLPPTSGSGKHDVYCEASIGAQEPIRTKTIHNSLAPRWNVTFYFECDDLRRDVLTLSVHDEDKFGENKALSECTVPLSKLEHSDGKVNDIWVPLRGLKPAKIRAKIVMHFEERSEKNERSRSSSPRRMLTIDSSNAPEGMQWGGCGLQGSRDKMEDTHVLFPRIKFGNNDESSVSYFAVYDGHGGCTVSESLAKKLHNDVLTSSYMAAFDITRALNDGFARADERYLETKEEAGSTAVVAIITEEVGVKKRLFVANTGDSVAILCRRGRAKVMTEAHHATNPSEQARVTAAGGRIFKKRLGHPVLNPAMVSMAVTRAFGDCTYKDPEATKGRPSGMIVDPHVEHTYLTDDDLFMILACDGIFDVLEPQECVDFVGENLANEISPEEVAQKMCLLALERGSTDNTSAVVVVLAPIVDSFDSVRRSLADLFEGMRFGGASLAGLREMEDMTMIMPRCFKRGVESFSVFGVFDGYGGNAASKYAAAHMSEAILNSKHLKKSVKAAIHDAFLTLDKDILKYCRGENESDGTTAVVAVVVETEGRTRLWVANAGDSIGVLCRQGIPKVMSEVHNPLNHSEVTRVLDAGGKIVHNRLGHPVLNPSIVSLSLTRSLGNVAFKDADKCKNRPSGMVAEPYIEFESIDESDYFLLLAGDGVFDVVDLDEATDFVGRRLATDPPELVARKLCDHAIRKGAADNVSAVIVQFAPIPTTWNASRTSARGMSDARGGQMQRKAIVGLAKPYLLKIKGLAAGLDRLVENENASLAVADVLHDWIVKAPLEHRMRISPQRIVRDREGIALDAVMHVLFLGVKSGLFRLLWDLTCPCCGLIVLSTHDLNLVEDKDCLLCNKTVTADAAVSISGTIQPSDKIEYYPVDTPLGIPEDAVFLHLLCFSDSVASTLVLMEEAGSFVAVDTHTFAQCSFVVSAEKSASLNSEDLKSMPRSESTMFVDRVQLTMTDDGFHETEVACSVGKVSIVLHNKSKEMCSLVIFRVPLNGKPLDPKLMPPKISAMRILHNPAFELILGSPLLKKPIPVRQASLVAVALELPVELDHDLLLAHAQVDETLKAFRESLTFAGGRVAIAIGTQFVVSYASAADAVLTVMAALNDLRSKQKNAEHVINAKLAIHTSNALLAGEPLRGWELFGPLVSAVMRIEVAARAGELLVSEAALAAVEHDEYGRALTDGEARSVKELFYDGGSTLEPRELMGVGLTNLHVVKYMDDKDQERL